MKGLIEIKEEKFSLIFASRRKDTCKERVKERREEENRRKIKKGKRRKNREEKEKKRMERNKETMKLLT